MTDEEKKAIEYLKSRLYGNEGCKFIDVAQSDLRIFLNLIKKQQAEIEKKDLIIDLMANAIDQTSALRTGIGCRIKNEECNMNGCEKCIIEYFTKKVEGEKNEI